MADFHAQVSDRTVKITSGLYPLKMAVVPRDLQGLGDEWEKPGIYVLWEPDGSTWRVYVGQTKELRKRIRKHRKEAEDGTLFAWSRALLVTGSFGVSEIVWLEWRMYGLWRLMGLTSRTSRLRARSRLGQPAAKRISRSSSGSSRMRSCCWVTTLKDVQQ